MALSSTESSLIFAEEPLQVILRPAETSTNDSICPGDGKFPQPRVPLKRQTSTDLTDVKMGLFPSAGRGRLGHLWQDRAADVCSSTAL